ncbi:MAG TPA: diacylglycerol kinase [Cytophagales bacterium]|nr:diacylglycerol kinase [Cytophagales bacterium]HAA19955.1 diacylglycerol kinase [Cytophagales bacterium]HAP62618.1 diacylglycerol kinase [Cytophagales bacterium]
MLRKRLLSFVYAFRGIKKALRSEPNLRIHAIATLAVTIAGISFHIPQWAWVAQTLAVGLVWSAELFNTVWEKFLDFTHPEHSAKIGELKDIAAGAVLVAAIAAFAVGLIIYSPYVWELFMPSNT